MNPDPIELNKQSYDRIAAQFAALTATMPAAVAEKAARLLARVPNGAWILDLGCGPGRDKAWLEALGARVVGADLSFGMLREAGKVSKPGLCQMEMRRLGFAAERFAGVWCNAALLHLPKQEAPAALSEAARVLVPGGLLFLSVQQGRGEGVESRPAGNVPRFFARYEPQEMAALLEQAGFQVARLDVSQDDTRSEVTWLWYETTRSTGPNDH